MGERLLIPSASIPTSVTMFIERTYGERSAGYETPEWFIQVRLFPAGGDDPDDPTGGSQGPGVVYQFGVIIVYDEIAGREGGGSKTLTTEFPLAARNDTWTVTAPALPFVAAIRSSLLPGRRSGA